MKDSIFRKLPMFIAMALTIIAYLIIDKQFDVTNKISAKIPVHQQWKSFFCFCVFLGSQLIAYVLGVYVLPVSEAFYFSVCGILTGLVITITSILSGKKKR